MDPWLSLTDYSIKYRVSVSTLRRRIKAEDLKYKFIDGKYYIIDEPLSTHQREHRPSQDYAPPLVGTSLSHPSPIAGTSPNVRMEEPLLATANAILMELKKAFSQILQEKEQQIILLRAENADLRTLAKVLENENERLRAQSKGQVGSNGPTTLKSPFATL